MQQKFIIKPNAWTDANKLPPDGFGNQHDSAMSMSSWRHTENWLPRSNFVYPSTIVQDRMAGAAYGNITAQLVGPVGFPMIEATNHIPAEFHNSQNSWEPQVYFTHCNHLQPSTINHPLYEQTMVYQKGSEGESTGNWRKPQLVQQPFDLSRDSSSFYGSNMKQNVVPKRKLRWPHLIYGSSCARNLHDTFWGENRGSGKNTCYTSGLKASTMFLPTHYPLTPYKKRLWKSERKPSSRKKHTISLVLQMLKASAKKGREGSETDGYKKRLKQPPSISQIKKRLLEELLTNFKLANSMEFSLNGSDEDSIEVRVKVDNQTMNINESIKNPNGWIMMNNDPGVEHGSSGCIKPVNPALPLEHDSQVVTDENSELLQVPRRFASVAKHKQKKERLSGIEKISPVTFVKEQDVLSIKSDMAYPKKLAPIANLDTSKVNTSVTKVDVVSTNTAIHTPLPSKVLNLKRTLKPTVPPWFPPRSTKTRRLPLLIKPAVKNNPWPTVKNCKHRIKPDMTSNTPEADSIHSPQTSEEQIQSKKKKNPQIRRRKKVIETELCKVQQKIPLENKEEPSAQDLSKRKSSCAFVMDCLLRMFTFTRLREKTVRIVFTI